jgi:glycosyltransferase involved in cell wall biosynthesis
MKIVYISNSIIPSRTANSIHVMKMCQALVQNGHEVVLLAPDRYKEYEENIDDIYEYYGVENIFKVIKLPYPSIRFVRNIIYVINVIKVLKKIKPDIVYGRDLYGCYFSSLYFNTSFEAHSPMDSFVTKYLLNKLDKSKNYKKTVVISDLLKKILLNQQNMKHQNIVVAHDGADKPNSMKKVLPDTGNLKVGYFGHLYKGRGIDVILDVAKQLTDIEFHIVGGNQSDIDYWKSLIDSDNVIFHGFVSPKLVANYRNDCDILVSPYQKEVAVSGGKGNTSDFMSPLKIFEYMSSKKAIVCSDLPVLREVLNEDNSMLVKYDSVNDWVYAIEKLKDNKYRDKLAVNAFDDFTSKYSWYKRAGNIIDAIQ